MGNIRYCRRCGHALSEKSRFCENCGAKVEPEQPLQEREAGAQKQRSTAQENRTCQRPETDMELERRTRYHQERLQGSWEESWNREPSGQKEDRITAVQYLLLGIIVLLLAALVGFGVFWVKGRSGARRQQESQKILTLQTDSKQAVSEAAGDKDSVITILDGDEQAQSGS